MDGPLDDGLVQVMAALELACGGRLLMVLGGKDELPAPVALGAGVLAGEGVGEDRRRRSLRRGRRWWMRRTRESQVGRAARTTAGKGDDAVALALGVANEDAVVAELDVLDAQAQALEQAHAGAVEKGRDEAAACRSCGR